MKRILAVSIYTNAMEVGSKKSYIFGKKDLYEGIQEVINHCYLLFAGSNRNKKGMKYTFTY